MGLIAFGLLSSELKQFFVLKMPEYLHLLDLVKNNFFVWFELDVSHDS